MKISAKLKLLLAFCFVGQSLYSYAHGDHDHGPDISALIEAKKSHMALYKSETCGCCALWKEHMENAGYSVEVLHPADLAAVKKERGIAPAYQSCHTGVTQGYVFEGHIPAKFVKQFLNDPPSDAIGLAVPGMPLGSPGMEMGERFTPYDIFLLKKDGSVEVFAKITSTTDQE